MSESSTPTAESAERYERDALAADARTLVERIEAIHPEPYVGYDGRVALHARLERVIRDLPETATAEEFYRRAAPLVAGLSDCHSALHPPTAESPEADGADRRLPLSFRVVGERLYVEAAFDESVTDLVGARLLSVEGASVAQLADRAGDFFGVENRYGALSRAGLLVRKPRSLARLLDRTEPVVGPTVRVERDGEERTVTPDPVDPDREPTDELRASLPHPPGTGPRYRLYEDGDAAVFVPGDLQGYRESFEVGLARDAAFPEQLAPEAYERHVGDDPPDDVEAVVAALPSMVETLTDLIDEMAAAGTETLVVDLRDNPGGDSQFVFHLAYVLRGWDGVVRAGEQVRSLKRRTEPHRERFGAPDDRTPIENPAGYDFDDFLDADEPDVSQTEELLRASGTFSAVLDDGEYEAAFDPERIVVAVSTGTMSSGFAGAAQLAALGADVVGVPSGQAPLSFGEAIREPLPNTGLDVSVAGAMYHWVADPDPDVLGLDRALSPALFDHYDRAADAGLRLAFDHAGVTDGRPPEPVDP